MTTTLIQSEKPRAAGGHTGLDNEVAGTNARHSEPTPGATRNQPVEKTETSLRRFWASDRVSDILICADAARALGYEPELRIGGSGDDMVEVFVKDVPALIGALQKSLKASAQTRTYLRDNDRRWLDVTDQTPVTWEGKATIWGELSHAERMECQFDASGQLVGAWPF